LRGEAGLQVVELKPVDVQTWRVEEEFVGAIRGTERVRLTRFEDGLRYMAFTDAVAESMATGRRCQREAMAIIWTCS
jgi:hypothetical protein